VEITGSPQVAYDGLSTEDYFECEVTPTDLEPSSYSWLAAWETPAYNNPQVTFTLPTQSLTRMKNAWWYATTTNKCTQETAAYDIYCTVEINGHICSNVTPALFYVEVGGSYNEELGRYVGGICHSPSYEGQVHYDIMETNGYYMVTSVAEPWNRINAEVELFHPSTSQFFNKVQAHENQHKSDYNNGFEEYVFIHADEYAEIVVGFTNATLDGLESMLWDEMEQYLLDEVELIDSLQDVLEERAYSVSDPILPFYVYQGVCEGY